MSGVDHTSLSVSDFAKAKAFYAAALKPLGISVLMEFPKAVTGSE
jgi:catechol 2,3-dioxygenase-like lactoylglutathione lyase family enzyme